MVKDYINNEARLYVVMGPDIQYHFSVDGNLSGPRRALSSKEMYRYTRLFMYFVEGYYVDLPA